MSVQLSSLWYQLGEPLSPENRRVYSLAHMRAVTKSSSIPCVFDILSKSWFGCGQAEIRRGPEKKPLPVTDSRPETLQGQSTSSVERWLWILCVFRACLERVVFSNLKLFEADMKEEIFVKPEDVILLPLIPSMKSVMICCESARRWNGFLLLSMDRTAANN